jgi:hypothetical protein
MAGSFVSTPPEKADHALGCTFDLAPEDHDRTAHSRQGGRKWDDLVRPNVESQGKEGERDREHVGAPHEPGCETGEAAMDVPPRSMMGEHDVHAN